VSEIENSGVHTVTQSLWGLVIAEGKVLGEVDKVNGFDVDLDTRVCGRSNRLRRLLESTSDLDKRLRVDLANPRNKVGITGILREDTLNGMCLVSEE
jgi:hypothetical protein